MSTAVAVHFEGLTLHPVPNDTHDWLMFTAEVAAAFGVDPAQIRQAKTRMSAAGELVEGKHWVGGVDEVYPPSGTRWTKRGVIRLGFNLRSPRAKLFRDYAEDLVLRAADQASVHRELADIRTRLAALEARPQYVPQQQRLFVLPKAAPAPKPNVGAVVARKAAQRAKAIEAISAPGGVASIRQLAFILNISWYAANRIARNLIADGTAIATEGEHMAIAMRVAS